MEAQKILTQITHKGIFQFKILTFRTLLYPDSCLETLPENENFMSKLFKKI